MHFSDLEAYVFEHINAKGDKAKLADFADLHDSYKFYADTQHKELICRVRDLRMAIWKMNHYACKQGIIKLYALLLPDDTLLSMLNKTEIIERLQYYSDNKLSELQIRTPDDEWHPAKELIDIGDDGKVKWK